MAKINYSPLEKLAEELSQKIKELKSGKLSNSEVHQLVETAQEVYNRMVILEFQLHDKGATTVPVAEEEPEPTPVEQEEEAEEMPEFNFNMPKSSDSASAEPEAIEVKAETPVEVENAAPEVVTTPEPEPTPEPAPEPEPVAETVAESAMAAADAAGGSIAEKFENAPVADLSKAYSLNEKFQFMRVFTTNNSDQFNALVKEINGSADLNSAMSLFENSVQTPEGEDLAVYDNFKELIIRRFS